MTPSPRKDQAGAPASWRRTSWPGSARRWTPARVAALIARLFGVPYTLRGVSYLLHRMGFTPQVAAHRAAERDEDAIAAWRSQTWARARALAAATGAWI